MMQDSQQRVTAVESVSRSPEDSTIPSHTNSQSEEETISPVEVKSGDVSTKEEEVKASPINGDLEWGLDDHDFPDGGKGWLVAFGEFCMIFATFGLGNSWVFQSHYQTVVLPHTSPSAISWIGSIQYCLMFLPGLVSGRLFDLGYLDAQRIPASIAMVVATFLVAECKEYWQFLLCQGIITGLGAGICYSPSVATISHWFKKKRSTAFGMSATGTAIGGTLLPIAVRKLIPSVGFKWTMRILGFILLVLLTINIALVKRRLPPINVSGGLFNWKAFKVLPYTLYVAASFLSYVGLYTVLTYIDVAGIIYGVSPDYSFYLVSIANASSLVGRVASGPICDRFGNLNVLIPSNILAAATTFAWPFCKDAKSLTILAVFYGVTFGSFASLVPAPVASLGGTGDVGRRTGMLYTFCGIACLIGPPISGAIFSRYNGFLEVGIYGGCMILGSSALMFAARWAALGGQLWGKF